MLVEEVTSPHLKFVEQHTLIYLNFMRYSEKNIRKFIAREYKEHTKISAKTLLRAALLNSYHISDRKFELKLKPNELSKKRNYLITSKSLNRRLSNTIDTHIMDFLHKTNEKPYKYLFCFNNKESQKCQYKKYYLPYINCTKFLLFFILQDGRVLDNIDILTCFNKESSCSITAYKTVVREVLKLYPRPCGIYVDTIKQLYEISQLYYIDESFHIFKLNRFAIHYKEFLSEDNLEQIYDSFSLKYKEVINLKDILNEEVFMNEDFIKVCFNSKHLDPLGVFIFFFKKYINLYLLHKNGEYIYVDKKEISVSDYSFTEFLSYCKTKTQEYFNYLDDYNFSKWNLDDYSCYFDRPQTASNNNERLPNQDKDEKEDKENKSYEEYNRFMNYKQVKFFQYPDYNDYPWYNYYFANRELLVEFSNSNKKDSSYLSYLFKTLKEFLPQSLF